MSDVSAFASRLIFLNSQSAKSLANAWTWSLNEVLQIPFNYQFRLSLVDAQIPYSFYAVHAGNNSAVIGGQTVAIEPGNYSVLQILAALRERFSLLETSYDTRTNKVRLDFGVPVTLQKGPKPQNLLRLLGISGDRAASAVHVSDRAVNVTGLTAIYIRTDKTTFNIDGAGASNVLAKIPFAERYSNAFISYVSTFPPRP